MLYSKPFLGVTCAAMLLAVSAPVPAHAANVVINALEGFDDPTPATPVGGNDGTTIGQQRLNAFQRAADLWGGRLVSDVDILVDARFSSLFCIPTSGVLGQAGPEFVNRDFPNVPFPSTWYSTATADAIAGSNLIPGNADIGAEFNADLGQPGCIEGTSWYLGFDGDTGPGEIDFLAVLLHELGHGLGFLSFVDAQTGQKFGGMNDTYMRNLEDHSTGKLWRNMNDAERAVSAIDGTQNSSDLHWTGTAVNTEAARPGLNTGVGAGGHTEMYAPNPFEGGSSVSHYAKTLAPNELMEPSYTVPIHELELSLRLMEDIGWPTPTPCGDADQSGSIVATDALIGLKTAVGSATCFETQCDSTGDGATTATDALAILNAAVTPGTVLRCGLTAQ